MESDMYLKPTVDVFNVQNAKASESTQCILIRYMANCEAVSKVEYVKICLFLVVFP